MQARTSRLDPVPPKPTPAAPALPPKFIRPQDACRRPRARPIRAPPAAAVQARRASDHRRPRRGVGPLSPPDFSSQPPNHHLCGSPWRQTGSLRRLDWRSQSAYHQCHAAPLRGTSVPYALWRAAAGTGHLHRDSGNGAARLATIKPRSRPSRLSQLRASLEQMEAADREYFGTLPFHRPMAPDSPPATSLRSVARYKACSQYIRIFELRTGSTLQALMRGLTVTPSSNARVLKDDNLLQLFHKPSVYAIVVPSHHPLERAVSG